MMKKLISTAILSSVIGSVSANPELGYMTLNTDNHHFFNATIAIDALPAELADKKLKVKLGSITDFYRHDIEYNKQVSSLRFKVTKDSNGKPIIRVRSIREITTEQLQAVVKLYVGRKKVYGIYDFQLGSDNSDHHVALNLLNADHKPIQQQFTANTSQTAAPSSTLSLDTEAIVSGEKYQVNPGRTISQIAMELLPKYPEVSNWQQLMEQLVAINPDAFVDGDINQLKSNALLNLPDRGSEQIGSEAITEEVVSEAEPEVNELAADNQKRSEDQSAQTPQEETFEPAVSETYTQKEKQPLELSEPDEVLFVRKTEQEPEDRYQSEPDIVNQDIESEHDSDGRYRVLKGETISLIAIKLSPNYPGLSHWRVLMDELVALNPNAFTGGDVNRLRAEVELQLPDPSQLLVASNSESGNWSEDQQKLSQEESISSSSENDDDVRPSQQLAETGNDVAEDNPSEAVMDLVQQRVEQPEITHQEQISETYQVIKGETISSIALKLWSDYPEVNDWKVLMDQLVMLNPDGFIDGDINQIRAGFSLVLPAQDAFQTAKQEIVADIEQEPASTQTENHQANSVEPQVQQLAIPSNATYQVSVGDSISSIAMKLFANYPEAKDWQVVMAQLIELNPDAFINGDSTKLRADAVLTLPGNPDLEVEAENLEAPKTEEPLGAQKAGTETSENLSSGDLSGKTLDSSRNLYQVENGETISTIAMKLADGYPNAGRWEAVMERLVSLNPEAFIDGDVNRLLSNALLILPEQGEFEVEAENQELPEESEVTVSQEEQASEPGMATMAISTSSVDAGEQYPVSTGESVSSIAMKLAPDYPEANSWKEVMEQLITLNPEAFIEGDTNRLRSDARLTLPERIEVSDDIEAENTEQQRPNVPGTYMVSRGDNLRSIALQLITDYPNVNDVQELMDRLVELNPDAFIEGDARRILAEAVLVLPTIDSFAQDTTESSLASGIEYTASANTPIDPPESTTESSYQVSSGESLRSISIRLLPNYPNAESVDAVMDRLVELNPEAFIGGDASRLLAESTLILPMVDDFSAEKVPEDVINESASEDVQSHIQNYGYSSEDNSYRVAKGDTLRVIAAEVLPHYSTTDSIEAVMEKLLALNPEAFIDGDPRRLLAEATLTLPGQEDFNVDTELQLAPQKYSTGASEEVDTQYQVSAGESVSSIAMKLLPNYPQVQDWKVVMNSLITLNPDAFIEGDANRLRSDVLLRVPGQNDFEIEAENQELPDGMVPDSSFHESKPIGKNNNVTLALANETQDQKSAEKKNISRFIK
ncbi:LysM peptidoglycan-binding domain-containing protein [Endozoicomonas sp.]|uniref:LysM peptidoglycan-binding domain-containing protein n=1 Tax=Endozoicomonas sp. TaxID=1892382 RepID=UPI003AF51E32